MKILITPYDSSNDIQNNFFVFDLEKKQHIYSSIKEPELECVNLVNQGRPTFRPFGIDIDENNIYISSNDRLGVFDKVSYDFKKLIDIPLFINTHQILKKQNYFYTCNTATDSLGINNIETKKTYFLDLNLFILKTSIESPTSVYSNDKKHINSLFPYKGKLYFCLHNRGTSLSEFYSLDPSSFEIQKIFEGGVSCHNIYIINDILYTLSTATGEIIEYNLKTNEIYRNQIVDPNISFLRGLDFYDTGLIIGCSNNYKNIKMEKDLCSLLYLNLKEGDIKKFMSIDEMYIISDLKIFN